MRKILNHIFLRKLGVGKFLFSAVAFTIGFTLVLLALQGYMKVREFVSPKKTASNYIIINKEVGLTNTLFGAKAKFTGEEINNLRQQPFVEDLGVFESNKFEASAYVGGNLGFYTELFFESVPGQFIDERPSDFQWQEGDDFLPIIISQDFLNLYNFGYAVGKGTPQLSKSTIQLVPLKVQIEGPLGRRLMDAKVVGFSERISSILVPYEFLRWANVAVANAESQDISRVIIKLKSEKSALLNSYLEQHGLRVADEKLKFSKLLTTLNVVLSILVVIGTAFMIFSLVIVMLNFSLMVAQAKEEVSLLLQLGYKTKHLVRHLSMYLLVFMLSVLIVSSMAFAVGKQLLSDFLNQNGINVSSGISPEVIGLGIVFIFVSVLISFYSIYRLIVNQSQR
jgi:hypothetical protein